MWRIWVSISDNSAKKRSETWTVKTPIACIYVLPSLQWRPWQRISRRPNISLSCLPYVFDRVMKKTLAIPILCCYKVGSLAWCIMCDNNVAFLDACVYQLLIWLHHFVSFEVYFYLCICGNKSNEWFVQCVFEVGM